MRAVRGLVVRATALFQRSAVDAELDEELRYHLDRETERYVAQGMSPRDARDAARRAFGNPTAHSEAARDALRWAWLEHAKQDVAYGWRALRRSPSFTAIAALSLALGIGANTMIFGVTYSVLLESLPVRNPEQLVALQRVRDARTASTFSIAEVDGLRAAPGVAGITVMRSTDNVPVFAGGTLKFSTLDLVDGEFFGTAGVRLLRGRSIDASDFASKSPVAVISQPFAERMFGSADRALGQVARVFDVQVSIIGVTPGAFRGLEYPGSFTIAVPMSISPSLELPDFLNRPDRSLEVVVRRANGVDAAQFSTTLDAMFQQCCQRAERERIVPVEMARGIPGGKDDARADYAPMLYMLLAGAAVVLTIACANVANLLLVRGAAREREIAIRMSLGASRTRVVRQLLTESLLLGVIGGLLAVPLAAWGTLGVERMIPSGLSVYADIVRWHPKPALIAFTALVSAACVMLFGLVPAFRTTRGNLGASLRIGGRGSVGSNRRMLDRAVVVAQLSLALLLVSAASLLVATLRNVARQDGGFATSGVTLISVETRGTPFERDGIVPVQSEILRRVRAIPGVERAGMSTMVPIAGGRRRAVEVDGASSDVRRPITMTAITPDYLDAAGIALRSGRDFTDRDDRVSERVAILSESAARQTFPNGNALGATIRVISDTVQTFRVVGIARDTRQTGLRDEGTPVVYAPVTQTGLWPFLGLAARMPDGSTELTRRVTDEIQAAAPGVQIRGVSTMQRDVFDSMFAERLVASIATLFGGLALLLSAIGIYGVIAFSVARRTNEIGVRMALGAQRREILSMVLRSSMRLVIAAAAIGGPMAFFAGRAMRSQLYGVNANNPTLLVGTLAVLVVVALIATSIPARRASRIDPLVALRAD